MTLTGVGGVGKTRLALEVAARSAIDFPDGVWVIELAPVGDPAAVPEAVAAVLGITQQPGLSLADSIAAALEGRSRLLVFDNCEHVLDAAAELIEAILAHSATVTDPGDQPGGLAAGRRTALAGAIAGRRQGRLRAAEPVRRTRPGCRARRLAVDDEDDDGRRRDLPRLDGIPLAIELAASRMVVDDRRPRCAIGSTTGSGCWSDRDAGWNATRPCATRCSGPTTCSTTPKSRLLTTMFGVRRRIRPAAACAVADADDELATLDLLDALVRKSLLVADRSSADGPGSRCWRPSASSPKNNSSDIGEADEARTAHARYFAGREADMSSALWDGPRQREAYDWFTIELANLRAAFRWAADNDDLDTAAAIAIYATVPRLLGRTARTDRVGRGTHRTREGRRALGDWRSVYMMAALC